MNKLKKREIGDPNCKAIIKISFKLKSYYNIRCYNVRCRYILYLLRRGFNCFLLKLYPSVIFSSILSVLNSDDPCTKCMMFNNNTYTMSKLIVFITHQ